MPDKAQFLFRESDGLSAAENDISEDFFQCFESGSALEPYLMAVWNRIQEEV
jgi:hypothetical protein